MAPLIGIIIKAFVVMLLFRYVMTRQELYFNPVGKFIASVTEPVFDKTLKMTKKTSDRYTPIFILALTLLYGLSFTVFGGYGFTRGFLLGFDEMLRFLLIFYFICILAGSVSGTSFGGAYTIYFYRLGKFWVKAARTIINIPSQAIVIPAVIILFIVYVVLDGAVYAAFYAVSTGAVPLVMALKAAAKGGLLSIVSLVDILVWLIIIRALMSWVSPDPRNPVVQVIASLTDPVIDPFRKVIPPLGAIDLTPMIVIFIIYFLKTLLVRLIGVIF